MKKRILKHTLTLTGLILATNAHAILPGFYMGLMFGPGNNNAAVAQAQTESSTEIPPVPPFTVPAYPKAQQFGSRIFMGYKMNVYAGFEFGLTYFSGIRYDTHNVSTCGSVNSRVRDFDFVFRGSVPFYCAEIFGKAGAALAYQTNSGGLNPNLTKPGQCGQSSYLNKVVPTYSFGLAYELSQNWVADVSYNNVQVGGKIGAMTYYAFGLSYHFVDEYCGQFLC